MRSAERDAQDWRIVARAVRAVDAQHRGPGPGMDDGDVLDCILAMVFALARDPAAARVETAKEPT